jgi:16S rRNA G966 N2-methylase RsmD
MLEREPDLVASLRASQQRLRVPNVRIERAEAVSWMRSATASQFQLVLLDPPFESPELLASAIEAAAHLVTPEGVIYVESGHALPDPAEGFTIWRQARAGAVWAQVLRRGS